jgi:hypothetical protein
MGFKCFFFFLLCPIHCFVIHHHLSNFKQPCPNTQRISPKTPSSFNYRQVLLTIPQILLMMTAAQQEIAHLSLFLFNKHERTHDKRNKTL